MKKGEIVIKVIQGGGIRTASIRRITGARKGVVWISGGTESDSVDAYNAKTGEAMQNYIPGFHSFLVHLDGGVEELIRTEDVE